MYLLIFIERDYIIIMSTYYHIVCIYIIREVFKSLNHPDHSVGHGDQPLIHQLVRIRVPTHSQP